MASYVGSIEKFNPYIQQIPTDAYVKVGMYKQQQYELGVQKVQSTVDQLYGLNIKNAGGRANLQNKVNQLTNALNNHTRTDFSNQDNVAGLISLAAPIYQDQNLIADAANTQRYDSHLKKSQDAFEKGDMEEGSFARETVDANKWLNGPSGGAYTGVDIPNTSTQKDILKRLGIAKDKLFEKNDIANDYGIDPDKQYYIRDEKKFYNKADLDNYIMEHVLTSSDRDMLMNKSWYENSGADPKDLQSQVIQTYQSKIAMNKKQLSLDKDSVLTLTGDDRSDLQRTIDNLESNNRAYEGLIDGYSKIDLTNEKQVDRLHRELGVNRFMGSLGIIDGLYHHQSYIENKEYSAEAAAARAAMKKLGDLPSIISEIGIVKPVDPSDPVTHVDLTTMARGVDMANASINNYMMGIVGQMKLAGIDLNPYFQKVLDKNGNETEDILYDNVISPDGKTLKMPVFRDGEDKNFYKLFDAINFRYEKEKLNADKDRSGFQEWVLQSVPGYDDNDPNFKFHLKDQQISDGLNAIRGDSGLFPKMDKLFNNPGFLDAMSNMDQALQQKKTAMKDFRTGMKASQQLSEKSIASMDAMSDEELIHDFKNMPYKIDDVKASNPTSNVDLITRLDPTDPNHDQILVFQVLTNKETKAVGKERLVAKFSYRDIYTHYQGRYDEGSDMGKKRRLENYLAENNSNGRTIIPMKEYENADLVSRGKYSYAQENILTTVENINRDKDAKPATVAAIHTLMTTSMSKAGPEDIKITNVDNPGDISGISDIEIISGGIENTSDAYEQNPVFYISFKGYDKNNSKHTQMGYEGRVSINALLATSADLSSQKYSKYFSKIKYAKEDAYARIHAAVDPLEGSASGEYDPREGMNPVIRTQDSKGKFVYQDDDPSISGGEDNGRETSWNTVPVRKSDGSTMMSYRVFSLGKSNAGGLADTKSGKGTGLQNDTFYMKYKMITAKGKTLELTFYDPGTKQPLPFAAPSEALDFFRDKLLFNKFITMEDIDPVTKKINYLTRNPKTLRGIFNAQMELNGHPGIDVSDLMGEVGKRKAEMK